MTTQHAQEWPEFENHERCNAGFGAINRPYPIRSVTLTEDEYKRARACVNACARWETAELVELADGVSMTLRELFDGQRDVIIELRQQRDELMAEMENALSNIEAPGIARAILRQAIAKVGVE